MDTKQVDAIRHRTKAAAKKAEANLIYTCGYCGKSLTPAYGNKRRALCSGECAKKLKRNIKTYNHNHKKRAERYGALYEYVNPFAVLERDKWTCQLCGCSTPRELRGSLVDNAPELDHITPINKGGAHVASNIQCTCRACNLAKGDATEDA